MKENIIILNESKKYLNDPRVKWLYENLYNDFKDLEIKIEDDKIIIYGDINIPGEYEEILYKIDEVYGNVKVDNYKEPVFGKLKTLENFPTKIHGDFICKMNPHLKSLKGGPEEVDGDFICVNCGLTSIEDMPKKIGRNFYIFKNNVEDISPINECDIGGVIDASFNPCEKTDAYKELAKYKRVAF